MHGFYGKVAFVWSRIMYTGIYEQPPKRAMTNFVKSGRDFQER